MDFHAGLKLIGDELRKEYAGKYDEVPNIVSYYRFLPTTNKRCCRGNERFTKMR